VVEWEGLIGRWGEYEGSVQIEKLGKSLRLGERDRQRDQQRKGTNTGMVIREDKRTKRTDWQKVKKYE